MLAIKHILFPVDFLDRCRATAPFVQAIATRFGAKVTLLNVLTPVWVAGAGDPGNIAPMPGAGLDEIQRDQAIRLEGMFIRELQGLPVERLVEVGDPAEVIVRFARTEGVDLIMMPTHGYGPFRSLLLGSVTAKVLHDAECPVWTAAHVQDEPVLKHATVGTVLAAIDGTTKAGPVMQWAADYARETGATLRLVHAIAGVVGWPERQLDQEFELKLREQARQNIERLQRLNGVTAPLCVAIGDVAEVVRAEAERHNADLILIGRGILHETMGRLRTHSYGIIRHAPCPVLSI